MGQGLAEDPGSAQVPAISVLRGAAGLAVQWSERAAHVDPHRISIEPIGDLPPVQDARVGHEHSDTRDAIAQPDRGSHHTGQRHERVGVRGQNLLDAPRCQPSLLLWSAAGALRSE